MAFIIANVISNEANLKGIFGGVNSYEYSSSDTVTAPGYFPKSVGFKDGDKIDVINITRVAGAITAYVKSSYYLKEATAGVLTAVALTAETSITGADVSINATAFGVITGATAQLALASADAALADLPVSTTGLTIITGTKLSEVLASIDAALVALQP